MRRDQEDVFERDMDQYLSRFIYCVFPFMKKGHIYTRHFIRSTRKMLFLAVLVLLFKSGSGVLQPGSLVYPKLLEERGLNGERFLRINGELTLKLEKSTILSRNLALMNLRRDDAETRVVNGTTLEENLYHNVDHMSSLVLTERGDGVVVEGILKHNLRIHPLPKSERSWDGLIAHQVHEIHQREAHDKVGDMSLLGALSPTIPYRKYRGRSNRTRGRLPETYVYEITVVLDWKYHRQFSEFELPESSVTKYVITLMNSVKLRFSEMRRPSIKVKVVGIGKQETNVFRVRNRTGLDAAATLRQFVKDRRKYFPTTKFDAVLILTGLDIIGHEVEGYSRTSSLCSKNAVVIAEDKPQTFNGVWAVTHELCHVLGAVHDGDPPLLNRSGHPGASSCNYNDHYLMGKKDPESANFYKLSECTQAQIRHVLSRKSRYCKREVSQTDLLKTWNATPGQGLSKQQYCTRLNPDWNRWPKQEMLGDNQYAEKCQVACCWFLTSKGHYTCDVHPLLDGQRCVGYKTCKNGVCGYHVWT